MQILIFGMHRSGSSMVARLLNMMGAYFAPEGVEMPAHPENPKGFWERQDVNELCIRLLRSANCEWYRISSFTIDKIPDQALEEFREKARQIILYLDAHRPWFLKDPRLCVLAPLWFGVARVSGVRFGQSLAFGSGTVSGDAKWIPTCFGNRPLGALQHRGLKRHTRTPAYPN